MEVSHKALLIPRNAKGEIYIQDREGHLPPPWGFFGGGIDTGETPLEAVIRETKEELDVDLTEQDLILLGDSTAHFGKKTVERTFFLYQTEQKEFTVLEGRGGYWMDYGTAKNHLSIDERFDEIIHMIEKGLSEKKDML